MFVFAIPQVIVGDFTKGNENLVRPPAKDPKKPHSNLYDSCVNDIRNPSIFVVFDASQCYPEYLLEYDPIEGSTK
jgi:poly [ADP-ribose] polymerase 7/11/12/13